MSDATRAKERAREALAAFNGRDQEAALIVVADLFERHATERTAALQSEADKYHQLLCLEIERVKELKRETAALRAALKQLHPGYHANPDTAKICYYCTLLADPKGGRDEEKR